MIASSGLRLLWVIFVRSTAPDARGMSASLDAQHSLRLLRARCERPRDSRAAERG